MEVQEGNSSNCRTQNPERLRIEKDRLDSDRCQDQNTHRKHFCMYLRVFSGVCVLPPSVFQQLYHAQALISASSLIHTRMKDPGNVLVFLSELFAASHSHLGASWCCEVQRAVRRTPHHAIFTHSSRRYKTFCASGYFFLSLSTHLLKYVLVSSSLPDGGGI